MGPKQRQSFVRPNIRREIRHITQCAAREEVRVVVLGPLVFFSSCAGDAWMLDAEDALALPLARDGESLDADVRETAETYAINWSSSFEIAGEHFVVFDRSGRQRTILGYPTREIESAIRRVTENR